MDFNNTFFSIDSMVVYKNFANRAKVLRLDEEEFLEFEGHMAVVWDLIANNKSLQDVIDYLMQNGVSQNEASKVLDSFLKVLLDEKMGSIVQR